MRLEFGNPEHIKMAAVGYAIAKAVEEDLTGELVHETEDCQECNGRGEIDVWTCSHCENSSNDEDEVVYSEFHVRYQNIDKELVGRCTRCKAKLTNG